MTRSRSRASRTTGASRACCIERVCAIDVRRSPRATMLLQLALWERFVRGELDLARLGPALEQAARDDARGIHIPGESRTAS